MTKGSFKDRIIAARPDAGEALARNALKADLALALRSLRKSRGLTQADVERRSTLSQPAISRLEAPTGSLPTWETVMRYVAACGGHMLVGFSADRIDPKGLVGAEGADRTGMISAVAV